MMKPKPSGLGPEYGAQFQDESVVRAYAYRLPYPSATFSFLGSLQPGGPGRALELGCGTGEITAGLAPHTSSIDAVDASEAMLAIARREHGDAGGHIRWHHSPAESFRYRGPYSLVVAAASLHWMDWAVVLPAIAASTIPGAWLAIVGRSGQRPTALENGLRDLIPHYSTNTEFEPYDLVEELTDRGMFAEAGRHSVPEEEREQSVEEFIESIHSQNGFSRDRMTRESAAAFDRAVRELAEPHAKGGTLTFPVGASIVWGRAIDPSK